MFWIYKSCNKKAKEKEIAEKALEQEKEIERLQEQIAEKALEQEKQREREKNRQESSARFYAMLVLSHKRFLQTFDPEFKNSDDIVKYVEELPAEKAMDLFLKAKSYVFVVSEIRNWNHKTMDFVQDIYLSKNTDVFLEYLESMPPRDAMGKLQSIVKGRWTSKMRDLIGVYINTEKASQYLKVCERAF